ncbi:MAG: PilT/PilU family type 4a pilus ATPase [Elusimicrobia bacterium]|nr:PilT/PilU family type 4a pilus ATPase [Elusimicrobiota bacterium]
MPDLPTILKAALEKKATDVFITGGSPPMAMVSGRLSALQGFEAIAPRDVVSLLMENLFEEQRRILHEKLELDCSFHLPQLARFRMNITMQKNGPHAVIRVIPAAIPHPDDLGLPPAVTQLADLRRGLVLMTGPAGSGKTATLACLIEEINKKREAHIVTIEDPIEFSFASRNALICQREIGTHTLSYAAALKSVLRQRADVVLIGELRDMETAEASLRIAESGALVFSTLSTTESMQTVERIVNMFPVERHRQISLRLAANLKAAIAQILMPRSDGKGLVAAREIMIVNPTIESAIREGKAPQIYQAVEAGAALGMVNLDKAILRLVRNKVVTPQVALEKCHHPDSLQNAMAALR